MSIRTHQIEDITFTVEKKSIRQLHLYVKPPDGRVVVTAPARVSDAVIRTFVADHLDWIRAHRARMEQLPPPVQYVTGDTVLLWGVPCPLTVNIGRSKPPEHRDGGVFLTVPESCTREGREKKLNEWYRSLLNEAISLRLPLLEQTTGLCCSDWQVKNMKTRWGTCNLRTHKIWLNLQLIHHPPEALDYVIVHELVHTRVSDHGPRFIAMMDKLMPDWRERRARLNRAPG